MKRLSIQRYVSWLTFLPLFIMAVGLGGYFLHSRSADMDRELMERGNLIAHQLASSSEYGVFSHNLEFLQGIANGALKQEDVLGIVILDANFRVLASAGQLSNILEHEVFNESHLRTPLSGEGAYATAVLQPQSSTQELWFHRAITPLQVSLDEIAAKSDARPTGSVVVRVSKARHKEHKMQLLGVTLAITLLFLAFTLYFVHIASLRITRPIRSLSEAIQAIGAGKLGTRVVITDKIQELSTLADGLNKTTEHLQQEQVIMQQRIDEATQALREKKEEAERVSQDKSRFLAVASHDLRQPLHALGLYVAELQRKLSGTGQQRLVGQIEQSVEALSALLNALLDISKLDAGTVVPQIRTCSMDAILKRIVADYQMLADVKNIRLVVRPCAGYITSDPMLLERVLANLVSNAIRYTHRNGSVMVACRRRKGFLRIEVRDNGVGISKVDQGNIFREFFQLTQPQLDTSKGLGLGLAIVDRLVKLLGHRLKLRSAPGKGSVFAVEVQMARRHAGRLSAITQVPPDPERNAMRGEDQSVLVGKRLLVVDDDEAILSSTSGILAAWGCQVNTAASVAQVERLMRDGAEWDFIVSDYQLENNTNGIDVIDLVRRHQGRQVPCVLISGDVSPTVLKLASVSGHHLLHKPVRPAKLRSLIEHLLADEKS